jgi:hypothetical protein
MLKLYKLPIKFSVIFLIGSPMIDMSTMRQLLYIGLTLIWAQPGTALAIPSATINDFPGGKLPIAVVIKKHSEMPPATSKVRVCRRGYGWHSDPYGAQVYGFWQNCHLAERRCATGHGWHYDPQGNQIFGDFWTCKVNLR